MDPQGSERYEHAGAHGAEHGAGGQGRARAVQLVADAYLLTVNPVDGSEVEPCPPGEQLDLPVKLSPGERPAPVSARDLAAPPSPPPFLERDEERERLARLLARGRSVRLTGAAGSGRSALLDAVAEDVATLAPDGVVRLSGYHRTPRDVLYELFAAVHRAPLYRPGKDELLQALSTVGAVVVLDDLEFGGAALDEVLRATPECAFLLAATPDVAQPAPESHVEEVFLAGLSRTACLELLEHAVHRPLTDQEADWAGDLWFGSEGLALRFVQAGALLRLQGSAGIIPALTDDTALAPLLTAALPESGLQTLRLALALDGELPQAAHLPALTGDQQADDCLPDLLAHGLISPAGEHFKLAPGVARQLTEAGHAEGAEDYALSAAQHYTWWAGHPSVTAGRVAVEAAPLLAAIRGVQRGGNPSAAVLLSRTAAPVFAAGLRWSAWERALRCGQESARASGEIAEEAYFHHELGVLALTTGNPHRAHAELEAAIALRGTLSEQRGIVAGRRALALVTDRLAGGTAGARTGGAARSGAVVPSSSVTASAPASGGPGADPGEAASTPHQGWPAGPPGGAAATGATASVSSAATARPADGETLVATSGSPATGATASEGAAAHGAGKRGGAHGGPSRWSAFTSSKRNVAAAGAGALLAAVLGTIVTLGAASEDGKPDTVRPDRSTSQEEDDEDGVTADRPPEEDGSGGSGQGQPAAGPGTRAPEGGGRPAGSSKPGTGKPSSPGGEDSTGASEGPSNDPGKPPSSPHDPPSSPHDPPSTPEDPPSSPDPTPTPTDEPTTQKPPSGPSDGDAGRGGGAPSGSTRSGEAPSGQGTPGESA